MTDYKKLKWARRILGLPQEAAMDQIKAAYRAKARECHPDKGGENEEMRQINDAYQLILQYCAEHRYSFREEDVKEVDPDGRFYQGWF